MFHYDPANTGSTTTESGPTAGATERWSVDARGDTGTSVATSPAVVDGTVYVGAEDGRLRAISATDGSTEWTVDTGPNVANSPAVVDGTVYVGSNAGTLFALDVADGSERWTFDYHESPTVPTMFSVAVVDDVVYFSHRASGNSGVVALDATDGTEMWGNGLGTDVSSAPAVANGTVYVGGNDYRLHALNASDGEEVWTFETTARVATPAVRGNTVYVPEDTTRAGEDGEYMANEYGRLYAVGTEDGEERWRFEADGAIRNAPAVTDDRVYVAGVDRNVYQLARTDGSEEWAFETGDQILSSPIVTGDTVYVGSDDGNLYALTTEGSERWTFETDDSVRSAPTAVGGAVYVGSNDGFVYALEES